MDFAFGTTFHHLAAYLMSNQAARKHVDVDVKEFLCRGGRPTIYASKLAGLQRTYRARTGRDLELRILSDHGHNRAISSDFLPVVEALESQGFRTARSSTRSVCDRWVAHTAR